MKYIVIISSIMFSIQPIVATNINAPMPIIPASGTINVVQANQDKELAWVDKQIKLIVPARVGVSDGYINSLMDPVKYTKPIPVSSNKSSLLAPPKLGSTLNMPHIPKVIIEPLRLQAIMNKSALINGKWYKVNHTVRQYTLSDIKSNSVILTAKKGEPLILFISIPDSQIKINTK